MFTLWQTIFNEALPTNWQNKVYKIHSHRWIIGNPKEWTSYLNTNSIEALCHARIDVGDLGMIQFRQAAFSFDEVLVGYSNRLTMTTHQSANTQPPVAVSQHLGKDVVTSDNREVKGLIKPLNSLTEPFKPAEQSWHWAKDQESKVRASKKKKKKPAVSGSAEAVNEEEEEEGKEANEEKEEEGKEANEEEEEEEEEEEVDQQPKRPKRRLVRPAKEIEGEIGKFGEEVIDALVAKSKALPLAGPSLKRPIAQPEKVIDLTQPLTA